jgi:hypothetical protein
VRHGFAIDSLQRPLGVRVVAVITNREWQAGFESLKDVVHAGAGHQAGGGSDGQNEKHPGACHGHALEAEGRETGPAWGWFRSGAGQSGAELFFVRFAPRRQLVAEAMQVLREVQTLTEPVSLLVVGIQDVLDILARVEAAKAIGEDPPLA